MFTRILVPLDGSETAETVLPYVIDEAKLHQADVVLFRVIAPLRQSLLLSPGSIQKVFKQIEVIAAEYLKKVAQRFTTEGIAVETLAVHGPPAQRILETAKEKECDLIIIGTHGETGAFQWRFGSVANKIIRAKSSIPVLVITTE